MTRSSGLQSRLLWGLIGAMSALWLTVAGLIWLDARRELDELLDAHLAQAAALLVAQQAHGNDHDDDDTLMATPTLHRYTREVAFQVWHRGVLKLRSPNAPLEPLAQKVLGFETRTLNGEEWRLFSTLGGEPDVLVYVGEQTAARGEITKAILRGLLGPLLLALPLILVSAWVVIRRGMRPLRELSASLAAREPTALAPLSRPPGTPAEIVLVIDSLNAMLERVARMLASERRFIADAAHELTTPIAGLRAQAQVALGATNYAERKHALLSTLQGCDRASHLVKQLLTLSRLDVALPTPLQGAVDLESVVRSAALNLASVALAAQQTLELEVSGAPEKIQGDDALLRVLVRNLVDNALRYSPAGSQIRLALVASQGAMTIHVDDSGPGMSEVNVRRLGERFFRLTGNSGSGSGLGWSIVRRIAQVHGAKISAVSPGHLGGLSVIVRFPTS